MHCWVCWQCFRWTGNEIILYCILWIYILYPKIVITIKWMHLNYKWKIAFPWLLCCYVWYRGVAGMTFLVLSKADISIIYFKTSNTFLWINFWYIIYLWMFFVLTVAYCAVLCCAVLCCAVLCCAVLCCAVLCCAALRCTVLCCAMLCCEFNIFL
jgi:hypothetical protein